MKLWEVLKALEENPKKKFECIHTDEADKSTLRVSDTGYLYLDREYLNGNTIGEHIPRGRFNGNLNMEDDWQEVKQPVTWQEALKAWAFNGKTIRCTLNDLDYIYKHEFTYGGDVFLESDGDPLELDEIKFGTWYIED